MEDRDGGRQEFSVVWLFICPPGPTFHTAAELNRAALWIPMKALTDDLYSGDAANLAIRYSDCAVTELTRAEGRLRFLPISVQFRILWQREDTLWR